MKKLAITSIIFLALALFAGSAELSANVSFSTNNFCAGDTVTAYLHLTNNAPESFEIKYIGLHFDWMAADTFSGQNLADSPVVIASGNSHDFQISVALPETLSAGTHTFHVGADGANANGQIQSWNSPLFVVDASGCVVPSTPTATPIENPTNTPAPTADQELNADSPSIVTYAIIAIVALVAIVAIVAVVLMKR